LVAAFRWSMRFRRRDRDVRLADTTRSTRRSEELEHALSVLTQHLGEIARHRVGPEEIVIQSGIRIHSFRRIEREQFVQEIASIRVLHIRF